MSSSLKEPSALFYQSKAVKRGIIFSYWTLILLAVPLWWHTTSIQRLSLPESRINSRAQEHLELPVSLCVADVEIKSSLQSFLDAKARDDSGHWWGVKSRVYSRNDCPTTSSYLVRDSQTTIVRRNEIHLPLSNFPDAFETLANLINPPLKTNHNNRVVQYSRQYRLAFTLLNEDASAGSSVSNWDVRAGLVSRIQPILHKLEPLHNFTIESQVQFNGRLAFQPQENSDGSYGVTPEDLTVFINSAEWSLSSSVSNDPVLHFVLFIPSALRRPLHILSPDGQISRSRSFLLPQWGGIVIYNPPTDDTGKNTNLPSETNEQIFKEFSKELLSLLGVPMLPNGVKRHISEAANLSDWQIDALMRRRTAENVKNTQETLTSIVKLVNQIDNMPVKEDVRDDVQGALEALEQSHSARSLGEAFRYSAQATTLSSRAFFNPGMLALLYFPAEHKYAVYTPLFASAVIPLLIAALKEIVAWKKERRASVKDSSSTTDSNP
ncbi:hypothetical protein AGABI1DRAFT_108623 [Agaricus bisporus var. burnettii JB137-S8]|uniref:GPI transamidase component PIG-S n=2 Tax=Agaricus bisporus var. burnettii TaxID=192524 RepID=K5WN84_AGABU|nr:uncharacterized protein AGABI1DRAFT_108623 [Agaricus bisporus var. burnettii JB137-S8]EKM76786.1 hypothetical protein AGABI1DRAFT_108623 [Agaricus bisporus var. burnettii JB137-S8]KAF7763514.1 hypothetical protein Agabi119p4_8051 [Agaricus bisporus var. burnettii]